MSLLGVRVDAVDEADTLAFVADTVNAKRHAQICTVNPEFIMRAQHDAEFADVLRNASLNVPDGVGVLWAARNRGVTLTERVTGSDMLPKLCAMAAREGWPAYFLGAAEGVAARCAAMMQARNPSLRVAGAHAGLHAPVDDAQSVDVIAANGTRLLFVAYGAPAQDFWIARNLPALRQRLPGGLVAIGVGGAFDFITGAQTRAPKWIQDAGFEWLYRLLREPRRLRRQLAIPRFILRILLESN